MSAGLLRQRSVYLPVVSKDTLGHSWQEVAQGKSGICMKGMLVAAKVMALTGAELFRTPETLRQ